MKSISPAQATGTLPWRLETPTAAWAPGYAQANLVVLPRESAFDFMLFAQRNPKACPVLDVTEPGDPVTCLAPGADLRTDLPAYRIWSTGIRSPRPRTSPSTGAATWLPSSSAAASPFERALVAAACPSATSSRAATFPCSSPAASAGQQGDSAVPSWCPCGPSRPTASLPRSRSPPAIPQFTAHRCTSATRRRSASRTCPSPISGPL